MSTPTTPKCFDSQAQWEWWRRDALLAHINPDTPFSFCRDCTYAYKAQMVREGRCENVTGRIVPFVDDEEEDA